MSLVARLLPSSLVDRLEPLLARLPVGLPRPLKWAFIALLLRTSLAENSPDPEIATPLTILGDCLSPYRDGRQSTSTACPACGMLASSGPL